MIGRRDMLIAGACAATLGAAELLRPRKQIDLLGNLDLSDAIPMKFGRWSAENGGDIVIPQTEGSLADRLYSKQLARTYFTGDMRTPVMLLIAYGASQSDALQLHRPEACYPAVGFSIAARRLSKLPVGTAVSIPSVTLTAKAEGRSEDIVYWARLGESLPQTAAEQRSDRLATAMRGYVGDGVLVRASMVRLGDQPVYALLDQFLAEMVVAIPPAARPVLIGSTRAAALQA